MNVEVVKFKDRDGKQAVAIINEDGLPSCFYLWGHLNSDYSKRALNTQYLYAHQLAFMLRHFNRAGIDIPERVKSGEFFTHGEYGVFERHCARNLRVDKSEGIDGDPEVASYSHFINSKQLDKAIHASIGAEMTASSQTIKGRLSRFLGYLQWLYKTLHMYAAASSDVATRFAVLEKRIKTDIKKHKDQNNVVKDPHVSVIPDDVYAKLMQCCDASASDNPFKGSRERNELIIWLLSETGIRKGALAKLKLNDIKADWDNPRVLVTRTPNDPLDPRKHKPSQKTKAHSAAVSPEVMKALQYYIEHIRPRFSAAQTHDFVFVAEKGPSSGQPLSISGVDYLFAVLSEFLGFALNPHKLRHKWNEIFDKNASDAGVNRGEIEDIRKNAMGWVEGSTMGAVYNETRLAKKASELSAARQREQFMDNGESDA